MEAAYNSLSDELKDQIAFAQDQIRGFANAQRETLTSLDVEPIPGVTLGHRHIPVNAVGAYVPGGRYPMLASAFMTVLVAKVAGVPRVVACAPPREGKGIHPAMLHAMATSGADEIICLGGVQALATMAIGLGEKLPPVDMIVGAGNAYVAEAKRQLFGRVGIDLLAGPTEILVIADESSDVELVAGDLLSQAEHGPTSPAWLISTSREMADAVVADIDRQLETYPTADFELVSAEPIPNATTGSPNYHVTGTFALRGRTESIDFPATLGINEEVIALQAQFDIDRVLWGSKYGSGKIYEALGKHVVNDRISISFQLIAPIE